MSFKAKLDFFFGIHLELIQEFMRHSNKCILGPGEEPINTALGEQRWELLTSGSEFGTNGGEGEDHMKAILDSIDEEDPELKKILSFELRRRNLV